MLPPLRRFQLLALGALALSIAAGATLYESVQETASLQRSAQLAQSLRTDLLELRRNEKDFIQRKDPKYQVTLSTVASRLRSKLQEIEELAAPTHDCCGQQRRAIVNYELAFLQYSEASKALGLDESEGLRAQVRRAAHQLEALLLTNVASPRPLAPSEATASPSHADPTADALQLLLLRRHEKDFLARKQLTYARLFEKRIAPLLRTQPPQGELWTRYADAFAQLVQKKEEIGLNENQGLVGELRAKAHLLEDQLSELAHRQLSESRFRMKALSERITLTLFGFLALMSLFLWGLLRSHRKLKQEEQRTNTIKEELRVTLESIGDGVLATDSLGRVTLLNERAGELTGWTNAEACGKPVEQVFRLQQENEATRIQLPLRRVLQTGEPAPNLPHAVLQHREGMQRHVALNAAPIRKNGSDVSGAVLVFRDVSHELKLEAQLRQAGKMESVGLLAGGIAHDFNNILMAIQGAGEVLQLDITPESEESEAIDVILHSAQRAAELTRQLLSFSRKGKLLSTTVDVHEMLNQVVVLLSRTIPKNVSVRTQFEASEAEVVGDPSQLEAVFVNLGINAADAIGQAEGHISYETRTRTLDPDFCARSSFGLTPGPYLEISVQDDGEGIPSELQEKIFEPFFTTKEAGAGTGLGLASAYGAIRDHLGEIRVYSELAQGTVFRILLPLEQRSARNLELTPALEAQVGEGRVLVVDDEAFMRTSIRLLLESLGYEAVLAENAIEGEAILEHDKDFVFLLIDMVMPKMGGETLFDRLSQKPNIPPVILMSGFTKEANVNELQKRGLAAFLRKPFSRTELSVVAANATGGPGPRPREDSSRSE